MQSDDITISEFGEAAYDVMTELAAAGFQGMSRAQADLVVRMGKLLDFAARKFAAVIEAGGRNELISRAGWAYKVWLREVKSLTGLKNRNTMQPDLFDGGEA